MIKTIIFDFDGMVHHAEGYFSTELVTRYNITEEQVSEFFKNEYKDCALGKLNSKDVLPSYLEKWNFPGDVKKFMKTWYEYGEFSQDMLNLIKKLKKKGIICVLVTNNEKNRINYYIKNYELDNVFDFIITSYMSGHMKPSKEMLDYVVKKININQENILFCDDKSKSMKTIQGYGFKTHIYTDINNFKKTLQELDVL